MEDIIEIIKAASYIVWPVCLLLIAFMFRREIRALLISLLPKNKGSVDTQEVIQPVTSKPTIINLKLDDRPSSHPIADDSTLVDQLIVKAYRNINSKNYSVFLEENQNSIYAIAPNGNIAWFEKKLFDPTIIDVSVNILAEEQREKFYWWIQNAESTDSGLVNSKKQPLSGYLPSYMNMLKNPNTEPSRMLEYIKSRGTVSWSEIQNHLAKEYRYVIQSGSMGASLRALEASEHVNITGQGGGKLISIVNP